MSVNTTLAGLSQTASSNGPDGSVDAPSTIDDSVRYALSFIALLRDGKGFTNAAQLVCAATLDIGAQNSMFVEVSGATGPVTSLGTAYNGPRFLRFTGTPTFNYNSSTLILPKAANYTFAVGDIAAFIPKTTAGTADGWQCIFIQPTAGFAATGANTDITSLSGLTTPLSKAQGGTGIATARTIVQVVTVQSSAVATGTTLIPYDATIPQDTEGDQYLSSGAFTPTNAASTLEIEVQLFVTNSNGIGIQALALFVAGTANALKTAGMPINTANLSGSLSLFYSVSAGSTTARTYNARSGNNNAGTTNVNGAAGATIYGSTLSSYIKVTEILP